jgi:hypothetical protein
MLSDVRCFEAVILSGSPSGRMVSWGRRLLAVYILSLAVACASPKPMPTQVFKTYALTTELQRGVSTMEDVRRTLGEPQGSGGFLFPIGIGEGPIWFYESIKVDASSGKIDLQQDVVLVFFKGGRFDGYLWFSDASRR